VPLRKELKEQFLRELSPWEKLFFLRKAREAIYEKCYPVGEDLFQYCWFLTLRERLRQIRPQRQAGGLRYLLAHGLKELEEEIRHYAQRLQAQRLPAPDREARGFLEHLSKQ
jgi:hypothetical protein